ncbi:LOW QUALITY PROTEIN: transcriptional regulator, MarR family [Vibrio sp. JCM 19052]|nr:LOW QUALITY PROTEIN: transcriptional regulator, MarR family [Vibrio sp. JCM 19052]
MEKYEEVLVSIRQIIRAIDLHSKKLSKESGLTAPQLILMRAISELDNVTIKQLSSHTNMSQATATTILDRLERNQLVERRRSKTNEKFMLSRKKAKKRLNKLPTPLQEHFISRFQKLEEWEQSLLLSSVQRISTMMNAEDIDVAPMLELGSITKPE